MFGKNYVCTYIAQYLYRKGMQSQFVHLFIGSLHFPHDQEVQTYQDQLRHWVKGNVTRCERSLFIFDEVDKMAPGTLNAIKPFLDFHDKIDGADFRKSIFIFLSNSGGNDITKRTLQHWKQGESRESITRAEMENIITLAAFNEEGGFKYSRLIASHLVDHFVPFLPLEKEHIRNCIVDYLVLRGFDAQLVSEEKLFEIADSLQYYPKEFGVYSTSGCKRVVQKVDLFLGEDQELQKQLLINDNI
ncbi:unnamed protein product [Soboliphyme baturini]|uniref:Torsin-2A n=1 Tax=Soboliphyme baturini TaxID=241478 RepID=A0A183J9Q1_9BILA|nr:unnamed protein product [Soboliphyme baturini]